MKIIIDKDIPLLSPEEQEDIEERARPFEGNEEAFRKQSEGVDTIVIPQAVLDDMKAEGIDPDEVVSMLIKAMGKQQ